MTLSYMYNLYMSDIKKTARAIIFDENNNLITIRRKKYKDGNLIKEYYVIPGGHLDENETFEDAVIREIKEELGIEVSIKKEIIHLYNNDLKQDEIFFECEYIDGEIGTGTGEEWTNPDIEKYGSYEIIRCSIKELENINLLPKDIKKLLLNEYKF